MLEASHIVPPMLFNYREANFAILLQEKIEHIRKFLILNSITSDITAIQNMRNIEIREVFVVVFNRHMEDPVISVDYIILEFEVRSPFFAAVGPSAVPFKVRPRVPQFY